MKRFQRIIGGFQKVIDKLDKLNAKCNKKAMKISEKTARLDQARIDQVQEGLLAKTAVDNLKSIFPREIKK